MVMFSVYQGSGKAGCNSWLWLQGLCCGYLQPWAAGVQYEFK